MRPSATQVDAICCRTIINAGYLHRRVKEMTNAKILLVESDPSAAARLEDRLQRLGCTVCASVSSGSEAIATAGRLRPDLALIDLGLAGAVDGIDVARQIGGSGIPVLYLTDDAGETEAGHALLYRARETEPFGYVLRQGHDGQLRLNIESALHLHQRERHLQAERRRLAALADERLRTAADLQRRADVTQTLVDDLQNQSVLMESVFDHISDGVVVVDEHGTFKIVSPSAERMVGMGTAAGPDRWSDAHGVFRPDGVTPFPPDELPLTRSIRGEPTDGVEMFIRSPNLPDGVYVSVNGTPIRDAAGALKGGVIVLHDITKAKQSENRLQRMIDQMAQQDRLMRLIFDSIGDGIVAANESREYVIYNPSAERIIGPLTTDADFLRRSEKYGFFYPDGETVFPIGELPLTRALHGHASDNVVLFVRNRYAPKGKYVLVNGRPLRDDAGALRGGVITFHDATERIRSEEALAQAFAQGRLEMVGTILHNIGNAINSVAIGIGTIHEHLSNDRQIRRMAAVADAIRAHQDDCVEYLTNDPQGKKVLPFLLALADDFSAANTKLCRTVDRVRRRVSHIVEIVRTQRRFDDDGDSASKDVCLGQTIGDAVALLRDSLENKGITLQVDCSSAPQEIRIRESQFQQMIVNLVKNAIEAIDERARSDRFDRPLIRIEAYVEKEYLVVDVIDNGIGIAANDLQVLATYGYSTKDSGSGLGLYSAASFAARTGGRLLPLSDGVGAGATIRVMLHWSSVAPRAAPATPGARSVDP